MVRSARHVRELACSWTTPRWGRSHSARPRPVAEQGIGRVGSPVRGCCGAKAEADDKVGRGEVSMMKLGDAGNAETRAIHGRIANASAVRAI